MKAKILAGLVTALVFGGTAMAQQADDTSKDTQQSPDNSGGSGLQRDDNSDLIILDQQDVTPGSQGQGVGGSGSVDQGVGGSGQVGATAPVPPPPAAKPPPPVGSMVQGQGGMTLYCTPIQGSAGTGGSGELQGGVQGGSSSIGYGLMKQPSVDVRPLNENEKGVGGSGYAEEESREKEKKKGRDLRGIGVTVGGGVEGYTGSLAPDINPGATAGVNVSARPSSVLGIEVGYSGAVNNLNTSVGGTGPDIVRNGGHAALSLGLAATRVQPYVLGGIGVSRYNIRHAGTSGFKDDTVGNVPVGAGLRTQFGAFTADARVGYNFLFSEDFAPATVRDNAGTGSYTGTLNLGGTF